jgi:hypothetical protein
LFYKGNTPDKTLYDNISDDEYKNVYSTDWSFQDESKKYLDNDLNCLHQVLTKANKQIFLDYNINMTDSITISGLAVKIFLKDYYKSKEKIIKSYGLYRI